MQSGAITFAEFMRLALYAPEWGYYSSGRGPGTDFKTAPMLSPVFGQSIARYLQSMWEALGRPAPFRVAEFGPGTGRLARDLLDHSPEPLVRSLDLQLVEPQDALRARQQTELEGRPVHWTTDGPRESVHCVIANEVVDSFPVHVVRRSGERLHEAYVVAKAGRIGLAFDEVSNPELEEYVRRYAPDLEEGDLAEVCLLASEWMRDVAYSLDPGYVVVIDYGDSADQLYAGRPHGTLAAYRSEQMVDPLDSPGSTDLTAHVNFTALQDAGAEAGLRTVLYSTQREFLLALGLRERLEELRVAASAEPGARGLALQAERSRVAALAAPGGMGDFKVLVMARDAPDPAGLELPRRTMLY